MSFTVADVIVDAREVLSDTLAPFRYSDDFIVRKVNQALRRMCVVRPDLFAIHTAITCAAGTLQSAPADSMRLMDVVTNAAGIALKEINQDTLDLMIPSWGNSTSAPATNWMRYPRDPNRFYVSPAQGGGELLNVVYARSPATLTAGDIVPLPDAYMPTVLDGTSWLMESIDVEHADSGRADKFRSAFENALTAGLTVRRLTDADAAGLTDKEAR